MYCITCKPIVEKQLKDEEAIKKIDIDYMTDSVVVEFDPQLITRERIKNRLEKSGYKFVRTAGARYSMSNCVIGVRLPLIFLNYIAVIQQLAVGNKPF